MKNLQKKGNKPMKKRIFSFFLALVMLFSCLSLNVFATEETTPATDSVTGDSLQPHTDEQLEAAIKNLTASEYGTYGFNNADALPTSNNTKLTLENGKIVFGGSSTSDSYVHLTTPSSGRGSLLTKTAEYKEDNGESFVVQVEFTPYQGFIAANVDMNLIKLSSYAGNTGYNGSLFRPKAIQIDYIVCTGDSIYAYNGKTGSNDIEVATCKAGEPIVIAIHVNPSDYDEEAGIRGSYDVYVNGELKCERISFFSKNLNSQMTMPTDRPYFTDSSFSGTTVTTPSDRNAYFFSDEFDVTVDADNDGVYDVYKDVPGIDATSGYPTANFIGEINGVRDYVLASARFGSTSANYGENVQAYAIDNMMLYYADEYVGTLQEHVFAESTTYIDPVEDRVEKTYVCPCGTRSDAVYEPLLFDVDLDEKLSTEDLESFVGKGNVIYNQEELPSDGVITVEETNSTAEMSALIEAKSELVGASYIISYDLTVTDFATNTGTYLMSVSTYMKSTAAGTTTPKLFKLKVYDEKYGFWYYKTSNSTAASTPFFALEENKTYNVAIHHKPSENVLDVYVDGAPAFSYNLYDLGTDFNTGVDMNDNFTPYKFNFIVDKGANFSNVKIYRSEKIHPCAFDGHSYEVLHTHDYESGTTTVGYKCTKCDKTYLDKAAENGNCAICGGVAISDDVVITGRNATLGELIDMNIYADVSDELAKTEGATATITCGDKTETVALKDAEKTENGYKFSLPLRSTQMADDVTLTIDGATYTTSIVDYATELIATNEEAAPVAKALLNYGAAAQAYFAVKNGDETLDDVLANAGLSDEDKAVEALDAETLSKYAFTQSGDTDEARFTGAKLQLASKTHMKLYFKASAGATVTVNEETVPVHYDSTEKEYYVFLSDITPTLALTDGAYTVVVTSGTTEFRTTLSAMTAVLAGAQDDDQMLSNLMNAYGQYCLKATLYRANNSEV